MGQMDNKNDGFGKEEEFEFIVGNILDVKWNFGSIDGLARSGTFFSDRFLIKGIVKGSVYDDKTCDPDGVEIILKALDLRFKDKEGWIEDIWRASAEEERDKTEDEMMMQERSESLQDFIRECGLSDIVGLDLSLSKRLGEFVVGKFSRQIEGFIDQLVKGRDPKGEVVINNYGTEDEIDHSKKKDSKTKAGQDGVNGWENEILKRKGSENSSRKFGALKIAEVTTDSDLGDLVVCTLLDMGNNQHEPLDLYFVSSITGNMKRVWSFEQKEHESDEERIKRRRETKCTVISCLTKEKNTEVIDEKGRYSKFKEDQFLRLSNNELVEFERKLNDTRHCPIRRLMRSCDDPERLSQIWRRLRRFSERNTPLQRNIQCN